MAQQKAWENEYTNPQLMTLGEDARKDVREYAKELRRKHGIDLASLHVLDLGCGTGRNALFFAEMGSTVVGLDISPTAIRIAKERAKDAGIVIDYRVHDIGAPYPFANHSFDLVLDVMSSNSLNEKGRALYLAETARVLTPHGHFFYRGLCKDGDTNVKHLLRTHPGKERDTYILPHLHLNERVFSERDFRALYGASFVIERLTRKSNYARMDGRVFKRMYWIASLRPPTPPHAG